MNCTFADFIPGTDNDPAPTRTYGEYLARFQSNARLAGPVLFGAEFDLGTSAIAKVEGDVFELLEAGALWGAAAAWNRYMDGGVWDSGVFTCPTDAVPTPTRKVAIVKLPRGYDATKLFKPEVRASIQAHEAALKRRGMELGLSSPDIVGVRLPDPMPASMAAFLRPIDNLSAANLMLLENAHKLLEGTIEATGFLLAIAVKRTTRSDRLYQPLFEANVLKYLIEFVLRGSAFRFYAHLNSFEGADVRGRYAAASLVSLIRGGTPGPAVDALYLALGPRDSAQSVLDDLPLFAL
ncbi:restriction endonuclease [Variovorax sp. CF313]|uniref:Cfr10I/Bse634I family restriction endonuclease n=1 Tax=Variovorax sp. CF313 TaxID=1144315 RepID=UPI000270EB95|nr:Cfr10I/Bse634I family restriction endonuclease [Variovorax sp. CF313]EJL77460.1 restriction endonuclease [Variovorax sp. CF313]